MRPAAEAPSPTLQAAARRPARWRAGWLVGPILSCASAAAVLLVLRGPDRWFGAAVALPVALSAGWLLACSLFPARADRRCPACGAEALARLDRGTTRGVRCGACAHEDAHASSFLMAEEEGVLEPLVLAERGRARRRRALAEEARGARVDLARGARGEVRP